MALHKDCVGPLIPAIRMKNHNFQTLCVCACVCVFGGGGGVWVYWGGGGGGACGHHHTPWLRRYPTSFTTHMSCGCQQI